MKWLRIFNSVHWKLVTIYGLLLLISMQLIGVYFFKELKSTFETNLENSLEKQAGSIRSVIGTSVMADSDRKKLDKILDQLTLDKKNTVQIVNQDGFIIATTGDDSDRAQKNTWVNPILQGEEKLTKIIPKAGNRYMLFGVPIKNDGKVLGAVYIEAPMREMYENIRNITEILIKITVVSMVGSSVLGIVLARTITNPIKEITEQATVMAEGDFDRQVTVKSDDEIGKLASAFNHLAQHLRDALSQNEEEKGRLQSVLANMSDGVIATDRKGKVIVSNRRAEGMLDKKIGDGEEINQVLPLANPLVFPVTEMRQTFLELDAQDEEELTVIKLTFTPVLRASREAVGLIVVLQDVTEEEKLDRQRKEFVANVSHELRTPLTTIKSYLEALDEGGAMEEPELASRFMRVTRQEAERMTRLIHDLLQLSRLDAEKVRFRKAPLPLESVLVDAADRFAFQCRQKEIDFQLSLEEDLPRVYADRDQIDQVLDNLLSNAVKYTPEGKKISLTARKCSDGYVEVAVADRGIGIPKKDLERIFERFYRVDKARSRSLGGTGLGLSIAREIVRAHGGSIQLESNYGKGTTVRFTLPPCEPEVTQL
ncbi:sensor histidine kinase VicK [Desmospora sp. 8437]|nr:ATP-binding protein [Kroppenstedtia eburnea]EGK10355.1 sensor histidine kinase VicK [Desmospora sp. 8437]QKI83576.1 cell wall metabolism sensor histidine kinase WalK [Kroppenstedtia eburnea]